MSEFAQQRLERLLPIFEEIQRVQLFTSEEVRRIIKKCKTYEHRMEKRVKKKEDFIKYIQYLTYFLALIRDRRRAIKYFYKKKEIDYAVCAKVDELFKTACFRFQADIKMWLSRIEFAKSQQLQINVSRIFMRMLQVHTDKPHLWIAAAKWELEDNGSVESARGLLQRGLRFNSNSRKIYVELFRLELLNVLKLHNRRKALLSIKKTSKVEENGAICDEVENLVEMEDVPDAVLEGKLAQVVFDDCAQTFKGDVDLCISFAKIAREFSFAHDLVDYIYKYIDQHYTNLEESVTAAVDRRYFENRKNIKACIELFENGLTRFDNAKMWRYYIHFYLKHLDDLPKKRKSAIKKCLDLFSRASLCEGQPIDEDLYKKWISICDNEAMQGEIIEKALVQYPKSTDLWEYFLKFKIATGSSEEEIIKAFNNALQIIPENEIFSLWQLAFNWALQACPERLEDLLKASFVFDSTISGLLKINYLQIILINDGIEILRDRFRQLCDQKPNSLDFYLAYYAVECAQTTMDVDGVRYCFEQALFEHGTESVETWLKYVEFELKCPRGDPALVSKIYERAIKRLNDEKMEDFMRGYVLLTKE